MDGFSYGDVIGLKNRMNADYEDLRVEAQGIINNLNARLNKSNRLLGEEQETSENLRVQIEQMDAAWDRLRAHLVQHAPNMVLGLDTARAAPEEYFAKIPRPFHKGEKGKPKTIQLKQEERERIGLANDMRKLDDLMVDLKKRAEIARANPKPKEPELDVSHITPPVILDYVKNGTVPEGCGKAGFRFIVDTVLGTWENRPGTPGFEAIFLPGMSTAEKLAYRFGKIPKWISDYEASSTFKSFSGWQNDPNETPEQRMERYKMTSSKKA